MDNTTKFKRERLTSEEQKIMLSGGAYLICPDCRGNLLKGPKGAASINVKCSECRARFNLGGQREDRFFLADRITDRMIDPVVTGSVQSTTLTEGR